ncbi:MAG: 1-deoxy-D-xylulose 5-phosphate reductoisomerase, partial [uncultured Blastococcus sp.]
ESTPSGHAARLHRLDRPAGDRRRPAEPRPPADHRSGRGGWRRGPAGRSGAGPGGPDRGRGPRDGGAGPAAGLLRGGVQAGLGHGGVLAARDPGRSQSGGGARDATRGRRPQRHHRVDRAGPHAGRAARRPHRRARQQGVADRRRGSGDRGREARPARARRLRALGPGPVPAWRLPRRGGPSGAHRERRALPRTQRRAAGRRHRRGGDGPPDVGHGPRHHDQLRHAGQQGPGADRGAPALRRPVRRHRRRRAPAVDRALDGDLRRRRHHRAGQPTGHAAADRAGPGLARAAARRPAGAGLVDREHLGVRAAGRGRVPGRAAGPCGGRGRRRRPGALQRRERGGGVGVRGGSAVVPGHRRPRRAYPRRRAGSRRPHLRRRRPGGGEVGPGARPGRHRPGHL